MPDGGTFIKALLTLLSGGAGAAPMIASAMSPSAAQAAPAPAVVPVPVPQQRPATLPGGTFTPAAVHAKTMTPDGQAVDEAVPPMAAAAAAGPPQPQRHAGILEQLLGGGDTAGSGARDFIRNLGGGMANLRNSGGDPYLSFAQGFGGSTSYADTKEAQDAATTAATEKTAYDRSQDAGKTEREIQKDRADQALKALAEERQSKTANLANQKTALEIRRLARTHSITTSQMIAIENAALKAGDNIYDPEKRKVAIDAARDELLKRVSVSDDDSGISGADTGLSGDSEITATNPDTGERMKLVDGAWVPM